MCENRIRRRHVFVEALERRTLFAAGVLRSVTSDFGNNETAQDVFVQKDGRVVVLGQTGGADDHFFVARYNVDGSLDTTFGNDGQVETGFLTFRRASAVAVGPNGTVIVAGVAEGVVNPGDEMFAIARFESD